MMDSEKAVFHMVVLFMNVLTSICRGEQIRLSPEVSELVIAEGNRLQLDCIHEYNSNEQSAYFTKNGEIVTLDNDDDYMITSKSRMINATIGTRQTTKTLAKDSTAPTDNGAFACKSGNIEASINVIVFKVTRVNALYQDNATEVNLGCVLERLSPEIPIEFYWFRQGTRLQGDRYNISNNGILRIEKPTLADIGPYNCTATFYPKAENEQTLFLTAVYLNAGPRILNITSTNRKPLTLTCNLVGFPHPNVTWELDGNHLNSTSDSLYVMMGESLVVYNQNYSGTYTCIAMNEHSPYNATDDIHIKDGHFTSSAAGGKVKKIFELLASIIITYCAMLEVQ